MISPEGEVIIEYYDNIDSSMPKSRAANNRLVSIPEGLSRAAAPTYTSSINCYNSYTNLLALSESSSGINYMKVSCTGYYSGGGEVGRQTRETPSGWTVLAYSAEVNTPSSPFPLEIASGRSYHLYKCTGYKDVEHNLNYKK